MHRSHVNQPEHYVSCVQVKVTDGGNGEPGPTVQFPAAYSLDDDYANFNIYNGAVDFPFPGPAVWDGAGSSTTTPSNGSTSDSEASAPSTSAAPSSDGSDTEVETVESTEVGDQETETEEDTSTSDGECAVEYVYV